MKRLWTVTIAFKLVVAAEDEIEARRIGLEYSAEEVDWHADNLSISAMPLSEPRHVPSGWSTRLPCNSDDDRTVAEWLDKSLTWRREKG